MYDDLIRVLVFYIGVKQKKKKRLNFVVLYLENTYKSTKNKVYCSNWETIAKKKKKKIVFLYLEFTYRSTKNKEYCSSWETAIKKKVYYSGYKKTTATKRLIVAFENLLQ